MQHGEFAVVKKVNHTGFTVTDLEAAIRFFRDGLGFKVTPPIRQTGPAVERMTGMPEADLEMAFAYGAGHVIELMRYDKPAGLQHFGLRPSDAGCFHLAFEVEDIQQTADRLSAAGFAPVSGPEIVPYGPRKGGRNIYVRGPDNLFLEFQEAPEGFVDPFDRQLSADLAAETACLWP